MIVVALIKLAIVVAIGLALVRGFWAVSPRLTLLLGAAGGITWLFMISPLAGGIFVATVTAVVGLCWIRSRKQQAELAEPPLLRVSSDPASL